MENLDNMPQPERRRSFKHLFLNYDPTLWSMGILVFCIIYLYYEQVEYFIICYIISILMLFLKETPIVPKFSGTGPPRNEEGNPVYLRFYKLSKSGTQMQRMYNPTGHYSIEALGFEFEQLRSGFQESQPSPDRPPDLEMFLGNTEKTLAELRAEIEKLKETKFKGRYNFVDLNCIEFANHLSIFLCKKELPEYILRVCYIVVQKIVRYLLFPEVLLFVYHYFVVLDKGRDNSTIFHWNLFSSLLKNSMANFIDIFKPKLRYIIMLGCLSITSILASVTNIFISNPDHIFFMCIKWADFIYVHFFCWDLFGVVCKSFEFDLLTEYIWELSQNFTFMIQKLKFFIY